MDKREFEGKKLELLTDEELKEVAGGAYMRKIIASKSRLRVNA